MSSLSASEPTPSTHGTTAQGSRPSDAAQPSAPSSPSPADAPSAPQPASTTEPQPSTAEPGPAAPAAPEPRRATAAVAEKRLERKYEVDESAPPAVSVKNLSITYRTTFEKVPTFKSAIVRFGRGERAVREVEAIQDLSFDVPVGTALGILGANGAGKSTLMRALAGVLPPSKGTIEVRGKISSLLSLGVGFNGALTGRENVVLGGLAQGLSREQVAERADEIAEFAEIGEFMDMPLRTYSSGMSQRLAFAVSVHMEPDILLIDEALSAGDAKFKNKAAAKMDELMSSARAMFLVTHSLASIRQLCNDAIWIHKGRLMMRGTPQECGDAYTRFLEVGETAFTLEDF